MAAKFFEKGGGREGVPAETIRKIAFDEFPNSGLQKSLDVPQF